MGTPGATSSREGRQGWAAASEAWRAEDWPWAAGAPPRRARATSLSRATKCKPLGRAGMTGLRSVDPPASKQGGCRPALRFLRRQSGAAEEAAAGDAVEDELHRQRRQQHAEPTRDHVAARERKSVG